MKKVLKVIIILLTIFSINTVSVYGSDEYPDTQVEENEQEYYTVVPVVSVTESATGSALDLEQDVYLDCMMSTTVVSVSIPLNVEVYINPNDQDGFIYGAIEIINNVQAPITVTLVDFEAVNIPFENLIMPDSLPDELDWDNLSVSQTKRYFALGIKPINYKDGAWTRSYVSDYVYASESFEPIVLGEVNALETAYLGLQAYYGKAVPEDINFSFKATIIVKLKE